MFKHTYIHILKIFSQLRHIGKVIVLLFYPTDVVYGEVFLFVFYPIDVAYRKSNVNLYTINQTITHQIV